MLALFSFQKHLPHLAAFLYSLAVSWAILLVFKRPPPRFMDLYLIGIAFAYARWSLGPALLIYGASLLFATWILSAGESLGVGEGYDVYRIFSYSLSCVAVLIAIDYAKTRRH